VKETPSEKQRKGTMRDAVLLGGILVIAIILLSIFPERKEAVITASWEFFIEMILILPAVMVIMGIFSVFVPKDMIMKYLGKGAGVKGFFLAILVGSLPTGPLYVAFPMASALLEKGARISSVVIFLSAWACIKIPQELVELQFLGPRFMAVRLSLTVIFVIAMGVCVEWIIGRWDKTAIR